MGVEQGGPSEEDLKVRTEAGEPEDRLQDVDEAHRRANMSEVLRESAKEDKEDEARLVDEADRIRDNDAARRASGDFTFHHGNPAADLEGEALGKGISAHKKMKAAEKVENTGTM